jgi:hypothetical protein
MIGIASSPGANVIPRFRESAMLNPARAKKFRAVRPRGCG